MFGENELFEAIRDRNLQKVTNLVNVVKRVKINCRDVNFPSEPTPLIAAAEANSLPIVEFLLKSRADVDLQDKFGKRAIWWAIKSENEAMVDILIKYKCNVNYLDKETGCTPLYLTIVKNKERLAQLLVHGGADVNLRQLGLDALGETPMIKAVQLGNAEIVKLLINCLADINAKTSDGLSALHYAIAYRRYDIVEVLLNSRVNMYAASKHGITAMTVAIEHDIPYMVRLLMEFGYNGNRCYSWGETPLEQAIGLHSSKSALCLIINGVNIRQRMDRPGYSYFHSAIENNMLQVARLLVLINPVFAQERWLRAERYPLALFREPRFRGWLERLSSGVWPLQALCRSTIFRQLGRFPLDRLPRLSGRLPPPLLDYCRFCEVNKTDDLYAKVPLTEVECPLDCSIDCQYRTCPPIEIVEDTSNLFLPPLGFSI